MEKLCSLQKMLSYYPAFFFLLLLLNVDFTDPWQWRLLSNLIVMAKMKEAMA